MSRPLRCLLVDDNPDDRALVLRELVHAFPELRADEITRATELEAALQSSFDFVITDYQLRWTDGVKVLGKIKHRYPDCPVIMFTGTGSEEIAVSAMKGGLDDYVLKAPRHYVRVATAVRTALERVESERRASAVELRLQNLLDRLQVGVFRAYEDGRIIEANPAFLSLLGLNSIADANLCRLFFQTEDYVDSLKRLKASGHVIDHQVQLCRADGTRIWVSLTQTLSKISEDESFIDGLIEDITARVKLEEELRQMQKMESIGQLAAGIAHDFNNILTIVQGYANVVLSEHDLRPECRMAIEQISSASERAASLTRQLLTFSRKQLMQLEVLDLNEMLTLRNKLLRSVLGEDVEVHFELAPLLPPIDADPTMLEQLLINLAVNARDAMPSGGRFTVSTDHLEIDALHPRTHIEAHPGYFVVLRVGDTGIGMKPEVLKHLFEPFFTTKEIGKGTGLGLAAVYGIVKQHHGWIEVTSKAGTGTTFEIFLPARIRVLEVPPPPKKISLPYGKETILVVEDEPLLRDLVCEVLESYGYDVLSASSGPEALKMWAPQAAKIDLLLTDVKMPGMDGMELARRLCESKPELKVLYTSGFNVELVEPDFRLRQGLRFLPKPYQPETLVQTVRHCLDD